MPKKETEVEITLIGTGGYGESILINTGNNNWIIVDSCIDPNTKRPLPLEYLRQINVNVQEDVKLVVCTHWHNDHILGLSQILESCSNANLSFTKAHDKEKFLRFISFDYEKSKIEPENSATLEFNKCIEIIEKRNKTIIAAVENKMIFKNENNGKIISEVYALSPSDFTMEKFDHEIGELLKEFGSPSKKITINKPNAKSVVLFLKLGSHRAILGADLEVSSNDKEGWINIIDSSIVIDKKSSLFKISHHGSENGYHQRIFEELLEKNPVAKLTSWNRGTGLPDPLMLRTFCSHSEQVFITSPSISNKPKERDKQIEKFIKKLNKRLQEIKYKKGLIRCRIYLEDTSATWNIELLENSLHVNKEFA